jgi:hypothetical protein
MADNPNHGTLRSRNSTDPVASRSETDAYLASLREKRQSVASMGRLIFALDATASRRPTWERACQLQAQMFEEVKTIGELSVQLVYYRGLEECRASKWISRPDHLSGLMGEDRLSDGAYSDREGSWPRQKGNQAAQG